MLRGRNVHCKRNKKKGSIVRVVDFLYLGLGWEKVKKCRGKVHPIFCAFLIALPAGTGYSQTRDRPGADNFSTDIVIEDDLQRQAVRGLATTAEVMIGKNLLKRDGRRPFSHTSMFLFSGQGYIVGRKVNIDVLDSMPKFITDHLSKINTNTDICYVQEFFDKGSHITIGVHDSEGAAPDEVFKCFVSLLALTIRGNIFDINYDEWKVEYLQLLGEAVN